MKHSVHFDQCDNRWDNALPMGNGCFGGMLFFEDHRLHMPMNHYEVYHFVRKNILPEDIRKGYKPPAEKGVGARQYRAQADANQMEEGMPFCYYREDAAEAYDPEPYSEPSFSASNPSTGELVFSFGEALQEAKQSLTLYVEDAAVELVLENASKKLTVQTITSRQDCIINKVTQSENLLMKQIRIDMTPYRDQQPTEITYQQLGQDAFVYTVSRVPDKADKPFVFTGILRLVGAKGTLTQNDDGADIILEQTDREFYVLTGISTQWRYEDTLGEGLQKMQKFADSLEELYAEHTAYWKAFFDRSAICLPDKFLEHVYYVNQYALDCCSGKDGVMKHHACGLNGLWDVHRPCLWRSVWYWDVNIQASFAGVFSSNRLDLAKVFSDGLLSYQGLAEDFARDAHDLPGCAIDYPYPQYFCIWPWCAQYLWFLYEYSLDKEYLRTDAYPLFLKLCEFAVALFQYDPETDTYNVYPDISPEQGPLAHNTTATVASVKYMLQFTLKAAEILEDTNPLLEKIRQLLARMPPYAVSGESNWGVHMKDSPDAPDNLWIRHPGMLMPLFPIGEFDLASTEPRMLQILSNTVDFLEERCEIGVFQGSWIAAAAARLGQGQTALRLLYERGIDHMLRSNGLTAEQTERFINFCLLNRQPLFYPCMMEYTGEMLAAVNEMLLQSHNGLIRVFPAIPDGDREWDRLNRNGYSVTEYIDRYVDYEAWKDVSFDKLLAKGAFEISAGMTEGKLDYILVHSQKGGKVRLCSPFLTAALPVFCNGEEVAASWENGVLSFDTCPGSTYQIGSAAEAPAGDTGYQKKTLTRETYTKRKVFIGEDTETGYHRAMDGFLRDWYLGNLRMENHTLYKFDFGTVSDKTYTDTWTRQCYASNDMALLQTPIIFLNAESAKFTVRQGYGFDDTTGITGMDRGAKDCFRRDFLQGEEPVEFIIDAPRGQYELLAVSGDEEEDSVTILEAVNGTSAGGELVKKGTYQSELLAVIQKKDVPIRLKISTKPGYRWKLNCLFLNTIKGY